MKILPQVAKIINFHDGKATCPLCKNHLDVSVESGLISHSYIENTCPFFAASYGLEQDYHFVIHNVQWINGTNKNNTFKILIDFDKDKTYLMQVHGDKYFEIDWAIDINFNDPSQLAAKIDSLLFYS
jgi:hypothetical protein